MKSDRYVIDNSTDSDGYVVAENLRTRQRLRFRTVSEASIYISADGGTVVRVGGPVDG